MQRASDAALDVIRDHLVDDDNRVDFPIDPFSIAEALGIVVRQANLRAGVSGVITKRADAVAPEILINRQDPSNRQRFTCAHEIGHFIDRQNRGDDEYGYVDERGDLAGSGVNSREIWANRFAAELLMPAFAVRSWFAEGWSASRLARTFEVSESAMNYRLVNLGLA